MPGEVAQEKHDQQKHKRVNNAGYRCPPAIVNVGHCTRNSTCGGNPSKKWHNNVGYTLSHQFHIEVVFFARDPVCNGGRQKRFDSTKHSNSECCREKHAYAGKIDGYLLYFRQIAINNKPVTDSLNSGDPRVFFEQVTGDRHHDKRDQRTWDFTRNLRCEYDDGHAYKSK